MIFRLNEPETKVTHYKVKLNGNTRFQIVSTKYQKFSRHLFHHRNFILVQKPRLIKTNRFSIPQIPLSQQITFKTDFNRQPIHH
jgi:hypothetical protein